MTHLLSLPTLHAAAPGVLEVVGGFDGDFDTAPIFHPPLWDGRRWVWDYDWSDAHNSPLALDLRVPSVAARLAGLCARALDRDAAGPAWVSACGEIAPEFWVLRYADTDGYSAQISWEMSSGRVHRRGLTPPPPNVPRVSAGLPDTASFLAALTLALAPRIAALRRTP